MRVLTGKGIGGKVVMEEAPLVEGSTVAAFVPKPDEEIEPNRLAAFRLAQAVREALEGDFLEEDVGRFLEELARRLL